MTLNRYRIVTVQNDRTSVSTVLLTEEEAEHCIDVEEQMHTLAGWVVTRNGNTIVARKGETVRVIEVRITTFHDDLIPETQ